MLSIRSILYALFVLALLIVPSLLLGLFSSSENSTSVRDDARFKGRVVGLDGSPIGGATVSVTAARARTRANGTFELESPLGYIPTLLRIEHPRYLTRIIASDPSDLPIVRMTPDLPGTVSLRFTGDVMFGRRFFDSNEDGVPGDGLLRPDSGAADHLQLLRVVQPLLEEADITAINLETPLIADPYVDATERDRPGFHPTKEFVFASAPASAVALRQAGVDVVDIGNNHLYDALDRGSVATTRALTRAGFEAGRGYFGGGSDASDALRPAIVTRRGQRFAFLGCTTITEPIEEGRVLAEDQVTYVATKSKAGAAACDPSDIAAKVHSLKQRADVVIVMVHGGYEYEPDPSPTVRAVSRAARQAGANLVVNHHPHVVGGLESEEGGLTAWTLGNFVFDQTVWPTFLSYMLTVDVRDGEVIRSYIDPLMIEGFRPVPVTGEAAGRVADIVERHSAQASVLSDGSVVFAQETNPALERDVQLRSPDGSSLWRLHPDTNLEEPGDLELGHDLLWVGSFEDDDVDRDEREGALWQRGPDVSIGPSAARSGRLGARMQRSAANCGDVFLNPLHRILVEGGAELSVVGWIRPSDADVSARLQLSWYDDTKGPSRTWSLVDLPVGPPGRWVPFRVDVPAPPWALAVGPYLRLAAPSSGQVHLDVDDLAVVSWTQAPEHGRGFGFVRAAGSRTVTVAAVAAEGTQAAAPRAPERLPVAETIEPPTNQEPQPTRECPSSVMQLPQHHEWGALPIKKASSPDSIHVISM